MLEIKAKGKLFGEMIDMTVRMQNKKITVLSDGEPDYLLEKFFMKELEKKYLVAGTYKPEGVYDSINIYNVLNRHFFDQTPALEIVKGKVGTMPDKGYVY